MFSCDCKRHGSQTKRVASLKDRDLQIKVSPSTGKKYAEFTIGDKLGGKMKKPRPATISDAIPYFNVWTAVHPMRDSPQGAYLFPSRENQAKYRNRPLTHDSLRLVYVRAIREQFPKLLDRPDVPLEDKVALKGLIYDKNKHRPYLRRHEFASEISPKVPQSVFNQLLGHSKTSRMYEIYTHELGDEGVRERQIARGIVSRDETMTPAWLEIQPKYCPMCHEPNKHNADFCFKCNWVISQKGMQEVKAADERATKEAEQQKKQLVELQERQERFESRIAANYDRLLDEVMRLSSDRLASIKDDRERQEEMNVLAVSGVEALAEREESEEQAEDTAIKEIEDKLLEEE